MKLISRKELQKQILNVSDATFWRLGKAGELPATIKIGGREYYTIADIEEWIRRKKEISNA